MQYPYGILSALSAEDREALGVYALPAPSFPPKGRTVVSRSLVFADGQVNEVVVYDPPLDTPTAGDVNAERERRLVGDFTFQGKLFQRDPRSLARITGAATLAGFAVAAGAPEGYLRWANADRDFVWIASDNSRVPMDAKTCFAFGQAAANVETNIIFATAALRDMNPIPADYADDKWWPA